MSQLMETRPGQIITVRQAGDNSPESQQGFDILKVLWRWKWLPILGAIIGSGLGYLHYSKQPQQFQATALIQVVESLPSPSRLKGYDPNDFGKLSRTDESAVIRSQRVLRMAVERGRLTEHPALSGKTADQIAISLAGGGLVVQPGAKDAGTTLIQISYSCSDRELCAAVVNAVVDGYSDYLSEEHKTVGAEFAQLVTSAQDRLSTAFKELNEKNLAFRKNAPRVIWTGDEGSDPYLDSYRSVSAELSALQSKRQKLAATLSHIQDSKKANRPPEAILLSLAGDGEQMVLDSLLPSVPVATRKELPESTPALQQTSKLDSESARLERTDLFALEMKERELVDKVGVSHPSLDAIRLRISIMKSHIAKIASEERRAQAELDRAIKEFNQANQTVATTESTISIEQRLQIREQAMIEQYAALEKQISALQTMADEYLKKSNEHSHVLSENRLLNQELALVENLLADTTEKINALELLPQSGHRTLKDLNRPTIGNFSGPHLPPYLFSGACIGFLVLSGLAVLMDLADRSYRNPDEIAQDLGMPVLGHIPVMETGKSKKVLEAVDASITTLHHSRGRVSEAYRAVRTSLYFSNRASELKVIQVTSPVPGDGKSTLSSNLAVTMAQSGRRVLLIDADFRRPRIATVFGIQAEIGMAAVVAQRAKLKDAIYGSPVVNLSIMPGGARPSNPAELLSSRRFSDLIQELRGMYDMIIVDTPPLLAVSDPTAVAAVVDGVILTMRLRRNVKPLAIRATKILESVDSRLLGVVVNGVSSDAGYGYSYGYNDYRYAYRYGGNYVNAYGSNYLEESHDVEFGPPSDDR